MAPTDNNTNRLIQPLTAPALKTVRYNTLRAKTYMEHIKHQNYTHSNNYNVHLIPKINHHLSQ